MRCKRVVALRRGDPSVLRVVETDLPEPGPEEVRIEVLAAPVSRPDVEARYGHSPFPPGRLPFTPGIPFVPGYAVVGDVDAVGDGVADVTVGRRVSSLTVYGGYAEYVVVDADDLIPVPATVDPVDAAPVVLNYLVAYQTMHRSARVEPGDTVVLVGASGGIGTALLQLGALADLSMFGIASKRKHHVLTEYGATPIDYHTEDFVDVLRAAAPDGIDAVIDGIGGEYVERGFSVLRRGGRYVGYANPGSLSGLAGLLGRIALYDLLPNGRSATLYGTGRYRLNRRPFLADWATLFDLLEAGEVDPIVARTFPLEEAARANELVERGDVVGTVVLIVSDREDSAPA